MKKRKAGKRHPLLIYQHFMNRLWPATLVLGGILLGFWALTQYSDQQALEVDNAVWLAYVAIVCLSFSALALLGRRLAYVQTRRDHLRLVTPFFWLRVSYRRVIRSQVTAFGHLFPPGQAGWAQRRFLEPFYGRTVVLVELRGYPMPPFLLHLFLSRYIFASKPGVLILMVDDWMGLSVEIDSFMGAWRQAQAHREHVKKRAHMLNK